MTAATGEIKKTKHKKKVVEKKQYSSNSVLNDVLNETAQSDEWKTGGGGKFDSSRMNELVGGQYSDMMNSSGEVNGDAMVASMGIDPNQVDDSVKNIFTKDYRSLMKAVDKKQGRV